MGNYVLEHSLLRLSEFHNRDVWPLLFDQIFLCAADVNEDTFERDNPLCDLHRIANGVSVYFNASDKAIMISEVTKGNPDRLGNHGAARPYRLHHKVQQIDCKPIAKGLVEHSYYLYGPVSRDIRQTMEGWQAEDPERNRIESREHSNTWHMT